MIKPMIHLMLCCFISFDVSVTAQRNLVLNGGFEDHGNIDYLGANTIYDKFPSLLHHWDNMNSGGYLYDLDYMITSDEKRLGLDCIKTISTQEGKSAVLLYYVPNCNGIYGYSSHLYSKSVEPLKVGHLYEVSYWLYIKSDRKSDPEWGKHIGIALLPQKISFLLFKNSRFVPSLTIDTVIYDRWYQVKWRVRPLCTSQYLTIGLFADDRWPKSQNYADSYFSVDNVFLVEIASESVSVDSSSYYCSKYDPKKQSEIQPYWESIRIHFETNLSDLSLEHQRDLDSLARFAKQYPDLVFEISGHTDSIGSDNLTLSNNRVQSTLKYLTETQKLPEFRFITQSIGSSQPLRTNNTEAGRQMNRRVEIRQSRIELSAVFYQRAIKAAAEKRYTNAFVDLNKWLFKCQPPMRMYALFDPRFEPLKTDKRWTTVEKKIRDTYFKFKYPKYAFLIDSLRFDDLRTLGELSWEFCEASPDSTPLILPRLPQSVVEQNLKEHYILGLKPIMEKVGWPKKSEFGEGTSASAFFLFQHCLDSLTYHKWLPDLKKTCESGEANWMHYAMLYDRCQLISGKLQRYGTHCIVLENKQLRMEPWEGNENTINGFRVKIGLPLLNSVQVEAMKRENQAAN